MAPDIVQLPRHWPPAFEGAMKALKLLSANLLRRRGEVPDATGAPPDRKAYKYVQSLAQDRRRNCRFGSQQFLRRASLPQPAVGMERVHPELTVKKRGLQGSILGISDFRRAENCPLMRWPISSTSS